MFYVSVFHPNGYGGFTVRPLRVTPYKTLKGAKKAIERKNLQGYVRQTGVQKPVWQNVASENSGRSHTPPKAALLHPSSLFTR